MAASEGQGAALPQFTIGECPKCHKDTDGVNDRYFCQSDQTVWSTNPDDDGVPPIFGK